MAEIAAPQPVKLICGLLARRAAWMDRALAELAERFGPADMVSQDWAFAFTQYYERQMGAELLRRFAAFEWLIDPGELGSVKRWTNDLEARLGVELAADVPRPVNLDPGYLALGKLVLASTKDFAHRVYLQGGIYAEVTLQFRQGRWQKLPWTFPDFAAGRYDDFLTAARRKLKDQLAQR